MTTPAVKHLRSDYLWRLASIAVAVGAIFAAAGTAAAPSYGADDAGSAMSRDNWSWPLARAGLDSTFNPPKTQYGRGHRGIDVRAAAGREVLAVAPGRVSFVGKVGSVRVVSIDHGTTRSTYQPVLSRLIVGDTIERGDLVGTLLSGPSHCGSSCLHLGRVATDDSYLDPLDVLGSGRFRLIPPNGPPPEPPAPTLGTGVRPVDGPITSPFGMRLHPITGVRKLHDGTDFAANCGTAVKATASGTVASAGWDGPYGKRIMLDHGGATTGYAHLSSIGVEPGQRVSAGSVIGKAGTTGLSTGCHLHLMRLIGGRPTDPASG